MSVLESEHEPKLQNVKDPNSTILLDGGFGRALEELGVSLEAPLWSANSFLGHQDKILEVHRQFIRAGAQFITTNTYALTKYLLEKAGLAAHLEQWLAEAYQIAHEAIRLEEASFLAQVKGDNDQLRSRERVKLAAGIGPLTETYRADLVDAERIQSEYKLLIDYAVQYKADVLLGEALSTVREAEEILRYARGTGIPVWISFTVCPEGNLRSGESLEAATQKVLSLGAKVVLVNCSHVEAITKSVLKFERMQKQHCFNYGAYPNRFTDVRPDFTLETGLNTLDDALSVEKFCEAAEQWVQHGASVIGGCCGIGPSYIQALARKFRAYTKS